MSEEDLRARPGHEAEFRATWKLRDDVASNPYWIAAYEWAATHKLTAAETNKIGEVLVRREEAAAGAVNESDGGLSPAALRLVAQKAEALRVAKLRGDLHAVREELEALRAEVRLALYLTPLGEVMGRGVIADKVQLLAALLREPEGT